MPSCVPALLALWLLLVFSRHELHLEPAGVDVEGVLVTPRHVVVRIIEEGLSGTVLVRIGTAVRIPCQYAERIIAEGSGDARIVIAK